MMTMAQGVWPSAPMPKHSAVTRRDKHVVGSHGEAEDGGEECDRCGVMGQIEQRDGTAENEIEKGHGVLFAEAVGDVTDDHAACETCYEECGEQVRCGRAGIALIHEEEDDVLDYGIKRAYDERAAEQQEPEVTGAHGSEGFDTCDG